MSLCWYETSIRFGALLYEYFIRPRHEPKKLMDTALEANKVTNIKAPIQYAPERCMCACDRLPHVYTRHIRASEGYVLLKLHNKKKSIYALR